ncbi:MAG TPA: nuclear transport factor 2 family protein [Sphingobacteriaceae bacterium]
MKTLKQTIVVLTLILVYGTASAFETAASKESMPVAISSYIDAVAYGKTDNLEDIIDNRAVFTITTGTSTNSYNKSAIISLIKANKSIQQNCETSYKVIESDNKRASVKVMYKYENFVRIDNITMMGGRNGWKIIKVASSYV